MGYSFAPSITVPSPVYSFTDSLPEGTTKLVLHWKGSEDAESFEIPTQEREGIALDLRLDYGNIGPGKNSYRLSIWQGEQLKEFRFFDIICDFEAKQFGDAILYMWMSENTGTMQVYAWDKYNAYPLNYLVSYDGEYHVLKDWFGYNLEKQELYEYRNLQQWSWERLAYGDLYINGKLMITGVPLIYYDSGAGNSLLIDYQEENAELSLQWRDGDGCGYMKWGALYSLNDGGRKLRYELKENYVDEGIILEYGNKKIDISVTTSLSAEEGDDEYYGSLDYRYFTRDGTEWIAKGERNLIPLTQIDAVEGDAPCGTDAFVLGLDEESLDASVKVELWNRRYTYTWKYETRPSYYRTSP